MVRDKIKERDAIKTTTMFLVDKDVEERFEKMIKTEVAAYQKSMLGISSKDELKKFIISDRQSIKKLITVLGITGEKFKRVVTFIRVGKGYTFDSEWQEETVQANLAQNPALMEEFCDLFYNGRNLDKYKKGIPKMILDDFRIDSDVISRVCSEDILRKLIKNSYSSAYSSAYSEVYSRKIRGILSDLAQKYGLHLDDAPLDGISRTPLLLLHNTAKHIIINYQYNLTTSKGQTTYAQETIGGLRSKCAGKSNLMMINILDGAGWVARSSDYTKVYFNCDYFFNLNTLPNIEPIIQNFFNIQ